LANDKKSELQNILNIHIKKTELFEQALTHRSYLQVLNDVNFNSNERLEFLGDAILGMVVAEHLFSLHLDVPEGELTKMRSWLVNTSSLDICARKLGLEKFLMMSFSAEKSLQQNGSSILADALEAIIAAIFLDSGYQAAKNFIINSLIPIEMSSSVMKDTNFKSILLEKVQALGMKPPVYEVLYETGPDHDKLFTVGVFLNEKMIAKGAGKNKKMAEQNAAKKAIENIH
jgi:ribonuclease III